MSANNISGSSTVFFPVHCMSCAQRLVAHGAAVGLLLWLVGFLGLPGCGGPRQLMPTPNLYAQGMADPLIDIDPSLQNNQADVVFLTDRAPENGSADGRLYGYQRSRSVAFGLARVQFGENVSWDQLLQASRSQDRDVDLPMTVSRTIELGRFEQTPRKLIELPGSPEAAASDARQRAAEEAFSALLTRQMAPTRVREVYVLVHGFNNTFEDGATAIAQLWHFFGRQGVPITYSWPAGSPGVRAYLYDRESSEFTVYHFKQAIRSIAACPQVQKINIIGHSRGTDIVTAALRELHLEIAGAAGQAATTRAALKLGAVVLAAPDIDVDVTLQRIATARVGQVPEQCVIYVQPADKALGLANWLFRGLTRLGEVRSEMFTPAEIRALRRSRSTQIIEARVKSTGAFGHDYFHSNPAVSSDLILLMRYQFQPGAEYGRPLGVNESGFWLIEDDYPGVQKPREPSNKK